MLNDCEMSAEMKLFAVYLGGRVPKGNTELHDVVFVVAARIEDSYHELMDKWFGDPLRVHLDSWVELQIIDGQRIRLSREPALAPAPLKLFFVNLGAYLPGQFCELHANTFVVAERAQDAKQRAKRELLRGTEELHTDDLMAIDDCIAITETSGFHVQLEPTTQTQPFTPHNGYHVIPKEVVAAYKQSRRRGKS
ncbi:MAG: hypothetical protein RL701_7241 [Pseudomonadota bacterium]